MSTPLPPPPPQPTAAAPVASAPATATPISGALVACVGLAVMAVGWLTWFALEDLLADAEPDRGVGWVTMAAMAAAGALWPVVDRGAATARRVLTGLVAGAAVGGLGGVLAGKAETHAEAAQTGAIDIANIATWAALGAAAWLITLGAASSAEHRRSTLLGAATGGLVSGGVMGALLGQFGASSSGFTPTDIWWSVPLEAADIGVRVLPVLVIGLAVPLVVASPTRSLGVLAGRSGVLLVVLVAGSVLWVQQDGASADQMAGDPGPNGQIFDLPGDGDGGSGPVGRDAETRAVDVAGSTGSGSSDTATAAPTPAPTTVAAPTTTAPPPPPAPRIPFPFDPGFEVVAAYDGSAANGAGETALLDIAFGGTHVADSAHPVSTGAIVCDLGPNDTFVPFAVQVSAQGLQDTTTVRVSFGQGGVEGADPSAHPMFVQWNYAGGSQCLPATSVATAFDAATSEWTTLRPGDPQHSYGYLVIRDYFDPVGGAATSSAGTGVGFVINDAATNSEWTLTGGAVGVVHDPDYGDYGAVLFG